MGNDRHVKEAPARWRWGLAGALGALAVAWGASTAVGCLNAPVATLAAPAAPPAGALTLPDLDEDGRPESLWLAPALLGTAVKLASSNHGGHTHDVLVSIGLPAGRLTGPPGGPWTLPGAALTARLLRPPGGRPPELVVSGGERAKRFVHVERGFLKLDAREVVPGFSAGLIMLGDDRATLAQLAGAPTDAGAWTLPLDPPIAFDLGFDTKERVVRITTREGSLTTRAGVGVGDAAASLAGPLPGKRVGADWRSPRYGMIARIGKDERVQELVIARPWQEPGKPD